MKKKSGICTQALGLRPLRRHFKKIQQQRLHFSYIVAFTWSLQEAPSSTERNFGTTEGFVRRHRKFCNSVRPELLMGRRLRRT